MTQITKFLGPQNSYLVITGRSLQYHHTLLIVLKIFINHKHQKAIIEIIQDKQPNSETVKASQFYFGISLPSIVLCDRIEKFEQKFRLRTELLRPK